MAPANPPSPPPSVPTLPEEIVEYIFDQAIEHAGDATACSLALASRRANALSFAPRWRLVHLLFPNAIYHFAVLLEKLHKKGRVLPVAAMLLWFPSWACVDERARMMRGLRHTLSRIVQVNKPTAATRHAQGQQALRWAVARVLEVLSPQLRRLGIVTSVKTFPNDLPLLLTHFPVLEELAVSICTERSQGVPVGFAWLSAKALPQVRRLHLALGQHEVGVALDWRTLKATVPGLTHLRLSCLIPIDVPALFTGSSPLPPGVQRVVFHPNPKVWDPEPCCVHGEEQVSIRRTLEEMPKRVRAHLRGSHGELAPRVALLSGKSGSLALRQQSVRSHTAGGAAIASEFGSFRGGPLRSWDTRDWDEGHLVLGEEMDEALAEVTNSADL